MFWITEERKCSVPSGQGWDFKKKSLRAFLYFPFDLQRPQVFVRIKQFHEERRAEIVIYT